MAKGTVSVVIPLFNGAATIERTLRSVCHQTYPISEIIVVDDGSTDGSAALVKAAMVSDSRIRYIFQANAGVANARNVGARLITSEYVAFIDADDLWAPEKIASHIAVFSSAEADIAMVYSGFACIDANDIVIKRAPCHEEGWILLDLLRHFSVGNGSNAVIRTSVFRDVGGFDCSLRARGAEGCEDLAICLAIAERYRIGVVPKLLVGYRLGKAAMSRNWERMQRSHGFVVYPYAERYPELRPAITAGQQSFYSSAVLQALAAGRVATAIRMMCRQPDSILRSALRLYRAAGRLGRNAWHGDLSRRQLKGGLTFDGLVEMERE